MLTLLCSRLTSTSLSTLLKKYHSSVSTKLIPNRFSSFPTNWNIIRHPLESDSSNEWILPSTLLLKIGLRSISTFPSKADNSSDPNVYSPLVADNQTVVKQSTKNPFVQDIPIFNTDDGRQMAVLALSRQKLKPHIIKRRLGRMRTYVGSEKNIRHSQWRLNLVCRLAAGRTLQDALNQLEFCKKSKAPLVQKVLKRTANLADIRDGLQMSQLEVAECFATKGTPLKRLKIMGRGRMGMKERQNSHFRVVLREIDFKLRLYQASTIGQKKRWFYLQRRAEDDAARVRAERDEIIRLEKQTASSGRSKKT